MLMPLNPLASQVMNTQPSHIMRTADSLCNCPQVIVLNVENVNGLSFKTLSEA
jgi:hypothetical protein